MKTSKQWLSEVKQDSNKFNNWLSQQWLAEEVAAKRILELVGKTPFQKEKKILTRISKDEVKHAELLKQLCNARNISMATKSTDRYYDQIELDKLTQDQLYAIGHYAEGMRLSRIRDICEDNEMPADIQQAFKTILKDEIMHEKAFGKIASPIALNQMQNKHELGIAALGLTL